MSRNNPTLNTKVVMAQSPDAWTAAADTSADIACLGFTHAIVILQAGTLGTSATLDCVVKGTGTAGATHAAITGAAFTQLVKATDDDTSAFGVVDLVGNGLVEISTTMTVGAATSDAACTVVLCNLDDTARAGTADFSV